MSKSTTKTKLVNRSIRVVRRPTNMQAGKVVVTQDGEETAYLLTRMETQFGGVAFRLDKLAIAESADRGQVSLSVAERYNVLLAGDNSSCDCKWGIYGAPRKHCRHVAGLMTLMAQGKLS